MFGSDPVPSSPAGRRAGFWTFWTTLPGILTGVAAVVTAIVSLIAVFNTSGGRQNNAAAPGGTSGLPSQAETSQAGSR
jgi:hypothetical protein